MLGVVLVIIKCVWSVVQVIGHVCWVVLVIHKCTFPVGDHTCKLGLLGLFGLLGFIRVIRVISVITVMRVIRIVLYLAGRGPHMHAAVIAPHTDKVATLVCSCVSLTSVLLVRVCKVCL